MMFDWLGAPTTRFLTKMLLHPDCITPVVSEFALVERILPHPELSARRPTHAFKTEACRPAEVLRALSSGDSATIVAEGVRTKLALQFEPAQGLTDAVLLMARHCRADLAPSADR